jgi:hypothetical protein
VGNAGRKGAKRSNSLTGLICVTDAITSSNGRSRKEKEKNKGGGS